VKEIGVRDFSATIWIRIRINTNASLKNSVQDGVKKRALELERNIIYVCGVCLEADDESVYQKTRS
jgi:hypothetical protein